MTAIFSFFLFYSFYSRFSSNTIHDRAKKLSYFFLLDFFLHTFSYYIFLSLSTRVTMKIKFQVCTEKLLRIQKNLKSWLQMTNLNGNFKLKHKILLNMSDFRDFFKWSNFLYHWILPPPYHKQSSSYQGRLSILSQGINFFPNNI